MTVKFKGPGNTKQNRLQLQPDTAMSFADEGAEEYFVAMGWAEKTKDKAVIEWPEGSVDIHPETVFADGDKKGAYVLPERAKAFQAAQREQEA